MDHWTKTFRVVKPELSFQNGRGVRAEFMNGQVRIRQSLDAGGEMVWLWNGEARALAHSILAHVPEENGL